MKGVGVDPGEGLTTIIRIKTAAKEHEVKVFALANHVNQYKEIKALAQLLAVEQRLNRVKQEATAGGSAEVGKLLALANEQLRKEYPDAQPLTAVDLQAARWQQDTLVVSFFRLRPRLTCLSPAR